MQDVDGAFVPFGATVICKVWKKGWLPESEWIYVDEMFSDHPEAVSVSDIIENFHHALQAQRPQFGVLYGYDWELRITCPSRLLGIW